MNLPLRVLASWLAVLMSSGMLAQDTPPKEPLCRAAWEGDLVQVRDLLSHGADPNVYDENGETPLMNAASLEGHRHCGDRKRYDPQYQGVAELLLKAGADVNARDPKGRTALLITLSGWATECELVPANEAMARFLVAHGANVNLQADSGWSPLLTVVDQWLDQPALMDFLIDKGADVKARLKEDGRTALMLAADRG